MEEFNNILERMQDARERWSTVRATLLKWRHLALGEEALDRFITQEGSRSVGRLTRPGDSDEDERRRRLAEEPPFYETELRVWARKPYRWRIETEERQGHSYVDIGDKAWRPDLMYHGYGPEEFDPPDLLPLDDDVAWIFDPRIALTTFDIQVLGRTTHAGREAVRLLALPAKRCEGPVGDLSGLLAPGGELTTTNCSQTPSGACCCVGRHGWRGKSSTSWRLQRSSSTRSCPRTYSIMRTASTSHLAVLCTGVPSREEFSETWPAKSEGRSS